MSHAKYTDSKTEYVNTMVVPEDRERMQEQISLPRILEKFRTAPRFSVTFLRDLPSGPRYYRIDIGKIEMSDDRTGVAMGFLDVDEDIRKEQTYTKVLHDARKAKEENRRLMEEVQSAAKLADLMASASSLLTNMPAMSFSKDAKTGKYLACNQAFADYAGKSSPDAVVGLTDHEIFDPVTAEHFMEEDRKALAMDRAYILFEDVPDTAGKGVRNLQTTKTKFRDSAGRLCLLGICIDITEMTRIKSAGRKSAMTIRFMPSGSASRSSMPRCVMPLPKNGRSTKLWFPRTRRTRRKRPFCPT